MNTKTMPALASGWNLYSMDAIGCKEWYMPGASLDEADYWGVAVNVKRGRR